MVTLPHPPAKSAAEAPAPPVVLAAVDVRARADADLNARIIRIAASAARSRRARLHVVHVWGLFGESFLACPIQGLPRQALSTLRQRVRSRRRARLEALVEAEAAGYPVRILLLRGRPGRAVRDVAEWVGAELVVMGAPAPSAFGAFIVSPMAATVSGASDYSVLLVRRSQRDDRGGRVDTQLVEATA